MTQTTPPAKGSYRDVEIRATKEGVTVILGGRQYDFNSLKAATDWIDRMYADAARRAGMAIRTQ